MLSFFKRKVEEVTVMRLEEGAKGTSHVDGRWQKTPGYARSWRVWRLVMWVVVGEQMGSRSGKQCAGDTCRPTCNACHGGARSISAWCEGHTSILEILRIEVTWTPQKRAAPGLSLQPKGGPLWGRAPE